MRKTKIVCTLGFASQTEDIIEKLMDRGMNVARFNFSHGTHESHKKTFDIVRKLREKKKLPIATLLDTRGPEIRLGLFDGGRATLESGTMFTLSTEPVTGTAERAGVSYADLPADVRAGNKILLDDGLIELKVVSTTETEVLCEVLNGGDISDRKGVNIPGVSLSMPYLSDQDRQDIIFGIQTGFDFIAASFVRCARDVLDIREILHNQGGDDILIISKIENAQGVDNLEEILRVSDGIMVARGDMGVEINFELLPGLQKMLIKQAYKCGKMVITATQMLESMVKNPRPTRAEATDVANAVYDGTSAVMLSGETAAGLYPVKAVETMALIATSTERDINYRGRFAGTAYEHDSDNVTNAISHATCTTAYDLGASSIVTVSMSGRTARNISKFRPDIPIIGCTASERTYRQLALSWGVVPSLIHMESDLDTLFENAVKSAQDLGYVRSGDLVVISTGVPLGISGTTNLLKVHIAGDVLVRGTGLGVASACGRLCVVAGEEEARLNFKDHDILVIDKTTNALMPILKLASAVVTEEDGPNSHAAIVCSALDIPVIVGAKNATKLLKNGTIVTVDPERGFVSSTGACGKKHASGRKGKAQ
ncbi:MAG: pyruvate kinase [Oscillospiraceae bacterium]|jgi:pyruvate kinase|nr:pyruvate kinase [Oscillospiraceae bacterium]